MKIEIGEKIIFMDLDNALGFIVSKDLQEAFEKWTEKAYYLKTGEN